MLMIVIHTHEESTTFPYSQTLYSNAEILLKQIYVKKTIYFRTLLIDRTLYIGAVLLLRKPGRGREGVRELLTFI